VQSLLNSIEARKLERKIKRGPSQVAQEEIASLRQLNQVDQSRLDEIETYLNQRNEARQYMNRPHKAPQVEQQSST
jgi:uncharacterized protein (DUF2384 family)